MGGWSFLVGHLLVQEWFLLPNFRSYYVFPSCWRCWAKTHGGLWLEYVQELSALVQSSRLHVEWYFDISSEVFKQNYFLVYSFTSALFRVRLWLSLLFLNNFLRPRTWSLHTSQAFVTNHIHQFFVSTWNTQMVVGITVLTFFIYCLLPFFLAGYYIWYKHNWAGILTKQWTPSVCGGERACYYPFRGLARSPLHSAGPSFRISVSTTPAIRSFAINGIIIRKVLNIEA